MTEKRCVPCQGGIPPLKSKEIKKLLLQLEEGWRVFENKELRKVYLFNKYTDAITFSNKIADLAEKAIAAEPAKKNQLFKDVLINGDVS